jgi:hypothetical protein
MFREACTKARSFTLPVFLLRRDGAGNCSGSIGTFVVVNKEGWIVTAGHIVEQLEKLLKEENEYKEWERARAAIDGDASLSAKEKNRQLTKLQRPPKQKTSRAVGVWAQFPGAARPKIVSGACAPLVDLGVGKLEPFDPAWVKEYPVFKDPTKNYEPGVSLCTMGFPFHKVEPTWDPATNRFLLPPNSFPAPLFPIDGIYTRGIEVIPDPPIPGPAPFPQKWLETSATGLRGQSGGPIFDSKGTIWAIQCQTHSYALGFDKVPNQYLNVGIGVHAETVLGLFRELGMDFAISDY